jgi:SAM-dependent methyltransferase
MNSPADTRAIIHCYDKTAGHYASKFSDELSKKFFERAYLKAFADRYQSMNACLLDAGCGIGHISKYLSDYGFKTIGIDLSPQMIQKANELYPGVSFEVADMRAMRFSDGCFSCVLALYSIIHFDYQAIGDVFKEINRVLISGGGFLLSFHLGNEVITHQEFLGEAVTIDLHLFEVEKICELLVTNGFNVIEVIERYPNPEIEYPSKRAYVLATKL